MSIEAMKQALEFLYRVRHWEEGKPDLHDTKEALRTAIAALESAEPVAQIEMGKMGGASVDLAKLLDLPIGTPLYTLEGIKK